MSSDIISLRKHNMTAGIKAYQLRHLYPGMSILSMAETDQCVVLRMYDERRRSDPVCRDTLCLNHFLVVYRALIPRTHWMHDVQHVLGQALLFGRELSIYFSGDAHEIKD